MDTYSVPYSAFFIAIFELVAIFWVYGLDIHMKNIYQMIGYKIWPQFYWRFMFKYGCPSLICLMLAVVILRHEPLTYNDYVFPEYSEYVGWALTASSVLLIPLFAILEFIKVLGKRKTMQVNSMQIIDIFQYFISQLYLLQEILRPEVKFGSDLAPSDRSDKSFDSISSIAKSFPEDLNTSGQDNYAFLQCHENFRRNLSHIANFEDNSKNNAKLLNFTSLSTWTCGNNSVSNLHENKKMPSLQNVFQQEA